MRKRGFTVALTGRKCCVYSTAVLQGLAALPAPVRSHQPKFARRNTWNLPPVPPRVRPVSCGETRSSMEATTLLSASCCGHAAHNHEAPSRLCVGGDEPSRRCVGGTNRHGYAWYEASINSAACVTAMRGARLLLIVRRARDCVSTIALAGCVSARCVQGCTIIVP